MEIPERVEAFLKENFKSLPRDVIIFMTGFMSPEDVVRLCETDAEFTKFCNDNKLFDRAAYDYVKQNAPLSEPIVRIQDQADAIRRGQTTVYKYDNQTGEVTMGISNIVTEDEYILFEIRGSPPKRGTKLWLFSNLNNDDALQMAQVYRTVEDFKWDLENFRTIESGPEFDNFVNIYLKNVPPSSLRNIIDNIVDDMIKSNVDGRILRQITLP